MLDHQWAVVVLEVPTLDDARAMVQLLPRAEFHEFHSGAHRILLAHGQSVFVEDTISKYCLAVGDTRHFPSLSTADSNAPNRHSTIFQVGKTDGAIKIITDRIGLDKVFKLSNEHGIVFSTHISIINTSLSEPQKTGIWFGLSNGVLLNNLTLYRDINILERETIHKITKGTHEKNTYWNFGFSSPAPSRNYRNDLKDALVSSVRDEVDERTVLLSLSGGFDSSGILGLITKFARPRELQSVSYVSGSATSGSDAMVAKKMASELKIPLSMVQAYDGDVVSAIQRNAKIGQGITNFCDEIDFWHKIGESNFGKLMIVGDEAFG
ncbi:MAG: hypothetical protein EXQ96_06065 [Alphaproteobacteria bacterium]|nr:hypothetical protein [Alphaproteobacteria bacterium]